MDLVFWDACASTFVNMQLLLLREEKKRRWWTHPMLLRRESHGHFHVNYEEYRNHPDWFEDEYLMPIPVFDELLSLLSRTLSKQDTNMRKSIGPCERLAVTLQYLATGTSYKRLQNKYKISKKTLAKVIKETCGIIWKVLASTEMAAPNKEIWKRISEGFKDNANFPHCLGALDGKHIRIHCPRNAGSLYFNYKKYNSIVLLALVDTNYLFTVIDVGSYDRENDSTIFQSSILGKKLHEEVLDLPEEEELVFNGPKMPYVIIADEVFGIHRNLMRPYPGRCLPTNKKIFNYRLSRTRRYVECVFGQVTSKFRIFHNTINLQPDTAILVIKAACILHNFIKRRAFNANDRENEHNITDSSTEDISNLQNMTPVLQRTRNSGLHIRNLFKDYFNTVGAVPWQNDNII